MINSLICSLEPEFKHYLYYNVSERNDEKEMALQAENMEKLRDKVSKIINDCKI